MPPNEDNSHYEKILATGEVRCIDSEIPFEIPKSWEWCRIKNIFFTTSGGTPKKGHPEYYINGTIPWVKSGELCDKYLYSAENLITEEGLQNSSAKYFPIDTVAVAMYGATIGKTSIFKSTLTTNQAICGIFPNRYIIPEYLYYFIQAKTPDYLSIAFGSGQPNISQDKIKETLFPVPPMIEQERIVKSLDILIKQVTIYDETQIKLKQLNNDIYTKIRKSILQEAIQGRLVPQIDSDEPATVLLEKIKEEKSRLVKEGKLKKKDLTDSTIFKGDDNKYYEQIGNNIVDITDKIPFDLPNNWVWCRLGEYIKMKIGKTPARGETIFWSNGIYPWVSISDMSDYGKVTETKEKVSEKAAQSQFGEISPIGTLLMSFKLTVGRTSVLDIEAYHNEAIISIYPYIDKEYITRNYLFYVLPFISNLGDSKDAIKGKTLNSKSLYKMLLPVPPLYEQMRIVSKITELHSKL